MRKSQGHDLIHPKSLHLCVSCVHDSVLLDSHPIDISECVHVHGSNVCKSQLLNDNVCDNSAVLINL